MTDFHDDFEARLRASLADQARGAPDAGPVADHVLDAVDHVVSFGAPERDHPRWRSWGLPLVAAAAVAAIVGGVVGVSHLHTNADPASTLRHSNTAPSPTVSTPPASVTSTPSVPVKSSGGTTYAATNFRVRDLTFVGSNEGWALGSADCLNGSGQTCTALAYSTDGTHWNGRGSTPFNVPGVANCTDPCVTGIRFATPSTGYAFGPAALFLTTDGAATWHRLPGGAAALETLNHNVIRVVPEPAGCLAPGCSYTVQTAAIGSTTWHATNLNGVTTPGMSAGVTLSRAPHVAVMTILGHPAGGASIAQSVLFTSTNDGATWTPRGDACPQPAGPIPAGPEVDTSAVTTAASGSVVALCTPRGAAADGAQFSISSLDGSGSWDRGSGTVPALSTAIAAASVQVQLVAGPRVYRSTDGGNSWTTVTAGGGLPEVVWLGFESSSDGRAVQTPASGASTIWTTHDGGASWTPTALG